MDSRRQTLELQKGERGTAGVQLLRRRQSRVAARCEAALDLVLAASSDELFITHLPQQSPKPTRALVAPFLPRLPRSRSSSSRLAACPFLRPRLVPLHHLAAHAAQLEGPPSACFYVAHPTCAVGDGVWLVITRSSDRPELTARRSPYRCVQSARVVLWRRPVAALLQRPAAAGDGLASTPDAVGPPASSALELHHIRPGGWTAVVARP